MEAGVESANTYLLLKIREVEALERNATANEELIRLATAERIEFDSKPDPPYCPHCATLNPRIANAGGEGQFNEFVLVATCGKCTKTFIAIPMGWQVAKDKTEARDIISAKGGTE